MTQQQGLTFVGDPEHVTREITAHALAQKNIELFARMVLPELRRA